jgi:hypothetical protein
LIPSVCPSKFDGSAIKPTICEIPRATGTQRRQSNDEMVFLKWGLDEWKDKVADKQPDHDGERRHAALDSTDDEFRRLGLMIRSARLRMERWEREDLIRQHSKLSEKMMEHYDRCSECCTDAVEQRGITCEVLRSGRS